MEYITKSDFLLYLESPKHLWAKVHGEYRRSPSAYDQMLMRQGYEVEALAQEYLQSKFGQQYEFEFQTVVRDGPFEARVDALGYDTSAGVYDLFEIKSSTEVKKEHENDAGFQWLVARASMEIRSVFVVILDKEYVRDGELVLGQLFRCEDVTARLQELEDDLSVWMQDAKYVASVENSDEVETCVKPKDCGCVDLCFGELPDGSIFEIARLSEDKKRSLLSEGINRIQDIPERFRLSPKQRIQVDVERTGVPWVDTEQIRSEMAGLEYPLYFLDYETFGAALPLHDGYHPHQQMTFQYSVHVVEDERGLVDDTVVRHEEFLCLAQSDPAEQLLPRLREVVGESGSVLVWNDVFERKRNDEMAELYPEYADFLLGINGRMVDLGTSFKKMWYVDPAFRGSWSIKAVLPVLVPELSYKELAIGRGDEAMLAWWGLVYGEARLAEVARDHSMANEVRHSACPAPHGGGDEATTSEESKITTSEKDPSQVLRVDQDDDASTALLKYCELDTWAMVEIWRRLSDPSLLQRGPSNLAGRG